MNKLYLKSSYTTPLVDFDPDKGLFQMEGRVIPEDAEGFFTEIFNWVDSYIPDKQKTLTLRFCLYYYNTGSAKRVFDIMRRFEEFFKKGYNVTIRWEYEEGDEDAMNDGLDYKRHIKAPFEIVKI